MLTMMMIKPTIKRTKKTSPTGSPFRTRINNNSNSNNNISNALISPRRGRPYRLANILWWMILPFLALQAVLVYQHWNKEENQQQQQYHRHKSKPLSSYSSSSSAASEPNTLRHGNATTATTTTTTTNRWPLGDGTLNGYPIYKQTMRKDVNNDNNLSSSSSFSSSFPLYSQFHCVGETWHPPSYWARKVQFYDTSWQYRSCHFEFFCYDVVDKQFVLYLDPKQHDERPIKEGTIMDNNNRPENSNNNNNKGNTNNNDEGPSLGWWDVSQTIYSNMTRILDWEVPITTKVNASTYHPYGISLGSINAKWGWTGIRRLRWFPQIRYGPIPFQQQQQQHDNGNDDGGSSSSYEVYTLPSSVVMVPYHSLSATNPGHLIWDDFLPIYTLMNMFGLLDTKTPTADDVATGHDGSTMNGVGSATHTTTTTTTASDLLLFRYVLPPTDDEDHDERGLWAGCDWKDDLKGKCQRMLDKFVSVMVQDEAARMVSTQLDPQVVFHNSNNNNNNDDGSNKRRPLICARNGAAGIGTLSDHGNSKGHGWARNDYKTVYNHGRGGMFWRFRNHMMRNLGLPSPDTPVPPTTPLVVYLSMHSSGNHGRHLGFREEAAALRTALERHGPDLGLPDNVSVIGTEFFRYTVPEQVEMVSTAAVYVTACGGGAVTSTFLPRGSSVLVYYDPSGGIENNKLTDQPARLDWDYLNNLGYLRVHWIPQESSYRTDPQTIETFTTIVLRELHIVYQQRLRDAEQ